MLNGAGLDVTERGQDVSDEQLEVADTIRLRDHDHDGEWKLGEPVLMFQVAIHRKKRIDSASGPSKKLAVLQTGPADALDGQDVVACQQELEVVREILVKQNAHW